MTVRPVARAGSQFPRDGGFRVHSVFGSAVNLVGPRDPYPVALLADSGHLHPRGAVVGFPPGWNPAIGDRAVFTRGVLIFDAPDATAWDFAAATGFGETVPRGVPERAAVEGAAGLLSRLQAERGTRLSLPLDAGSPFGARFSQAAELLPLRFIDGARRLLGLGEGLTPSGDDFLVGWMAAVRMAAGAAPPLGSLKDATSLVSAGFLDSAERGLFAAALVAFARDLSEGQSVESALGALARIGHSSGLDAATGLLVGLERLGF